MRQTIPENPAVPILNLKFLDALLSNLGRDKLLSVIDIFFATWEKTEKDLQQQVDSGNMEELLETSHRIKGLVKHIGMDRLGAIAGKIQQNAQSGDKENIRPLLEEFLAIYAHSAVALKQYQADIIAKN